MKEDESFLLKMMERTDIAVVSEGLFCGNNTSVWELDYIADICQHTMCHNFRIFDQSMNAQQKFDNKRKGTSKRVSKKEETFEHFVMSDTSTSMNFQDYTRYLHQYKSVQEQNGVDTRFSYNNQSGTTVELDVRKSIIYMIDLEIPKMLNRTYEDFINFFRLPSLLPGGKHCLMNAVSENYCCVFEDIVRKLTRFVRSF
jgi:hypothetical protein